MVSRTPRLVLSGVTKRYGAVTANHDISLSVAEGSIHAVLGENGAGKSTLMKIIYGVERPDAGTMFWQGQPLLLNSPREARALGVSMVFQHFALFEGFSAAENVWLGVDRSLSLAEVRERLRKLSASYGLAIEPDRPVSSLSVGEKQQLEIARALMTAPRLLILDEPTSVLTPAASEALFGTLRKLRGEGCSILYISHKLGEILRLCDQCSVLRKGAVSGHVELAQASEQSLASLMLASVPPALKRSASAPGELALSVRDLSLTSAEPFGVDLERVSLTLHAGEIVGIAGMSGSGQGELLRALTGEQPAHGITLFGQPLTNEGPAERRALGMRSVPEERLGRGLVGQLSLRDNTLLTRTERIARSGWVDRGALRALTRQLIDEFGVKATGTEARASSLSGGNLQKFLMGRELSAGPRVLLVAQPTWGVDVGAASEIRSRLLSLRAEGVATLLISEDLDELFALSDRLHVMARGSLSPAQPTAQTSAAELGVLMAGGFQHEQQMSAHV